MPQSLRHYGVSGVTTGASTTAGEPAAVLWNPSGSISLLVTSFTIGNAAAANISMTIQRVTTRGTAGSTVTPDLDNDFARQGTPASGAVLDMGDYTAAPTTDASVLHRYRVPSIQGSEVDRGLPEPIEVPPGTGLAVIDNTGVIAGINVCVEWDE